MSVPQEVYGPPHSRLSRVSWASTRNDERGEDRVLQKRRRTSCECPTKRNPKIGNHLPPRMRPTSSYKGTYSPRLQGCDKGTTLFRYASDKAIPWNYTNHVVLQEPQAVRVSLEIKQEPSVNDIVGTGRLTCNGRCYAPGLSRVKNRDEHTKQSNVRSLF